MRSASWMGPSAGGTSNHGISANPIKSYHRKIDCHEPTTQRPPPARHALPLPIRQHSSPQSIHYTRHTICLFNAQQAVTFFYLYAYLSASGMCYWWMAPLSLVQRP